VGCTAVRVQGTATTYMGLQDDFFVLSFTSSLFPIFPFFLDFGPLPNYAPPLSMGHSNTSKNEKRNTNTHINNLHSIYVQHAYLITQNYSYTSVYISTDMSADTYEWTKCAGTQLAHQVERIFAVSAHYRSNVGSFQRRKNLADAEEGCRKQSVPFHQTSPARACSTR